MLALDLHERDAAWGQPWVRCIEDAQNSPRSTKERASSRCLFQVFIPVLSTRSDRDKSQQRDFISLFLFIQNKESMLTIVRRDIRSPVEIRIGYHLNESRRRAVVFVIPADITRMIGKC
jgi:hypothetical protein